MHFFMHGCGRQDVMSELQQPPGVQEEANLRTKSTMLRMKEQNSGNHLGAYAVLNKPVLDPETSGFLVK